MHRLALNIYEKTGKIYGTGIDHKTNRTAKRFGSIVYGARSRYHGKGRGGGQGMEVGMLPGPRLDIPMLTRKDEVEVVGGYLDTEGRAYLDQNPEFKE